MKTTHLTPAPYHSAVSQPPRRLAAVLSLVALLLLSVGAALGVHAAVSPHAATASHAACHATQVMLHGRASPSVSCLERPQGERRTLPRAGSSPLARLVGQDSWCDDDALVLYWDSPVGSTTGPWLCIDGAGVLNLTQFFNSYYWNDQASAFWTGCYADEFAVNTNLGGATAYADGSYDGEYSPSHTFPYQGVGNDQLSSVYQFAPQGGDNC